MKKFTPLAMKCSQKDWDSIKGRFIGINLWNFSMYNYITNNYSGKDMNIENIMDIHKSDHNREIHETFNAKTFLNACGIDCDVYEITKLQARYIEKQLNGTAKEQFREWFPEFFKKELVAGKWYKNLDKGYEKSICCVIEVNKDDKDCFSGYGIDYVGEYFYEPADTTFCGSNNWQEATPQEIEAALICEAKKRGFEQGCTWRKGYFTAFEGNQFGYCFESNTLFFQGATIFENGIWEAVDIIETITIQEAEKLLNKKIV